MLIFILLHIYAYLFIYSIKAIEAPPLEFFNGLKLRIFIYLILHADQ